VLKNVVHSFYAFYRIENLIETCCATQTYYPEKHVVPLRHITLIPSQEVIALIPKCCMLSGKAANTNFIVSEKLLSWH
jgi:hypothetical protein